jgi:hypothetical protein
MNIQHITGIFLLLLLLLGGAESMKRQRLEYNPPVIDLNTDDESGPLPDRPAGGRQNVGRRGENIGGSGSSAPMTHEASSGFPILNYGLGGTSDDLSALVRSSDSRMAQSAKGAVPLIVNYSLNINIPETTYLAHEFGH